jgi:hypothetical protein
VQNLGTHLHLAIKGSVVANALAKSAESEKPFYSGMTAIALIEG